MTKITVENLLAELSASELSPRDKQRTVNIVVVNEGTMGATPTVNVKQASFGFDWDSQMFMLFPEQPLTTLTREEIDDISKSVHDTQSFHTRQLLKENYERERTLREFIKNLDQSSMTTEQKEFISQLR
jgi:hypothetical protein